MPRKIFTDKEIGTLSENKYVERIDRDVIVFTGKFKEHFVREYYDEGRTPREIFFRVGIDPTILGDRRVAGISKRYRAAYETGRMADAEHKQRFTKEQIQAFRDNPYVRKVTETTVSFTDSFKEHFIKEYFEEHKRPSEIFRDAGFDTKLLGYKRIERCSSHWRKDYKAGMLRKEDKSKAKLTEDLEDARRRIAELEDEIRQMKNE